MQDAGKSLPLTIDPRRLFVYGVCSDGAAKGALDALVFPTTLIVAGAVGQEVVTLPGGTPVPATLAYTQNVVPASYAGLAGLSLPAGLTGAGLPVGLEIDGLEGSDERVLGIGLSMETALERLPPPPSLP